MTNPEGEMRTWDPGKVKEFLSTKKISPDVTKALFDEGFRGESLLNFTKQEYKELDLKIPGAEIILIIKWKNEYIEHKTEEIVVRQTTRTFGKPSSGVQYKAGNFISHEIGRSSLFEPSREFKAFTLENNEPHEVVTSLTKRLAKFAAACMNSRTNGTIYFGIGDNKDEQYKHGEIVGMNMKEHDVDQFEDSIAGNLRGKSPSYLKLCNSEAKKAFSSCLSPIKVIKLLNCDRIVLEVDVKPDSSETKYLVFPVNFGDDKKCYFYREGTSSSRVTEQDLPTFLNKDVRRYASQRIKEENELFESDQSLPVKLDSLICKNSAFINDKKYKYFLITNSSCKQQDCCNIDDISSDFDWIKSIEWEAVFDFDETSEGLHKSAMESKDVLIRPLEITVSSIAEKLDNDPSGRELKSFIDFGKRTTWVSCSGNEMDGIETVNQWNNTCKKPLISMVQMLTHKSMVESDDSMVFVVSIASASETKKMKAFVKDLSETLGGVKQMVFVYQKSCHFNEIKNGLLNDCEKGDEYNQLLSEIEKRDIQIDWSKFKTYIEMNSRYKTIREKLVTSSNGIPVPIQGKVVDRYAQSGLEILGSNECDQLREDLNLTEEAKQSMNDFLKGNPPDWKVFFFSEESRIPLKEPVIKPLIERDLVRKIVERLRVYSNKKDQCMRLLGIDHLPGTGATTIAKHVLWRLRSEFRCVMIDGKSHDTPDYQDIATKLLALRGFGESQETVSGTSRTSACKPLLVLMDNSSYEEARSIQKKFQDHVSDKKIEFEKTVGMILYIQEGTDKHGFSEDDSTIHVNSKYTEEEKQLFTSKLDELMVEKKNDLDNMIGFLIFVNVDNDPYIAEITMKILLTMRAYPSQLHLLLYLAIFKQYGNSNLSEKHCKNILGPYHGGLNRHFFQDLCEQAQLFTRQSTRTEEGFGSYSVLEISSIPIAKFLVSQTLNLINKTLIEVMIEMTSDDSLLKERYLKNKLANDIKRLLIHRDFVEGPGGKMRKQLFSPIIMDLKQENQKHALKLINSVEQSFEKHALDVRPVILQSKARFHLHIGEFEEAETAINEAIELKPKNFTFHDTLGQIHKTKLWQTQNKKELLPEDTTLALVSAKKALRSFRTSQDIFENSKSTGFANTDEDMSDPGIMENPLNSPGIFGELSASLALAEVVIRAFSKNESESKALRDFMQGKNVEVEKLFIRSGVESYDELAPTIAQLYERSKKCLDDIMKNFDTKTIDTNFDELVETRKHSTKFGEIFSGGNFRNLPDIIKAPRKNANFKRELVRKYIDVNLLHSFYFVKDMPPVNLSLGLNILLSFQQMCEENDIEMGNHEKLCLINLTFASHMKEYQNQTLSFNQVKQLSNELLVMDKEIYEPCFWYLVNLWPNSNSESDKCPYYDEKKLVQCVKNLKEMNYAKSWFVQKGKETTRRIQQHPPLFYLTEERGLNRVIPWKLNRLNRKRIKGKVISKSSIEILLPRGTKVELRAAYFRWLRGSSAHEITCELGFTLAGPVAYDIQKDYEDIDRMMVYNDQQKTDHGLKVTESNVALEVILDISQNESQLPLSELKEEIYNLKETHKFNCMVQARTVNTQHEAPIDVLRKRSSIDLNMGEETFKYVSAHEKGTVAVQSSTNFSKTAHTLQIEKKQGETTKLKEKKKQTMESLKTPSHSLPDQSKTSSSKILTKEENVIPVISNAPQMRATDVIYSPILKKNVSVLDTKNIQKKKSKRDNSEEKIPNKEVTQRSASQNENKDLDRSCPALMKDMSANKITKKETLPPSKLEKKKENEPIDIDNLKDLPGNYIFDKGSFPKNIFWNKAPYYQKRKIKKGIEWAKTWIKYRAERLDHTVSESALENLSIDIAFNKCSNRQLEIWTNIQEGKLKELGKK